MMKKINLLMLAAFSMAIVACTPDNSEGNGGPDADQIIGTWYIGMNPVWPAVIDSMGIEQPGTLVFAANGKFTQQETYFKSQGTYSYSKGVLSLETKKSWWYDSMEEEYIEVPDSEISRIPTVYAPKFLYNGNIMVQKMEVELDSTGIQLPTKEEPLEVFFKEGTTVPSDVNLIQGFWNWKAFGRDSTTRLAVKFDGSSFTFWNPSWHEFFQGTYEYKNGMVKFNVDQTTFRFRRWWELPGGFNTEATENLNKEWIIPNPIEGDRTEPSYGWEFVMPFIVDGEEAYSSFANLHCIFDKQ